MKGIKPQLCIKLKVLRNMWIRISKSFFVIYPVQGMSGIYEILSKKNKTKEEKKEEEEDGEEEEEEKEEEEKEEKEGGTKTGTEIIIYISFLHSNLSFLVALFLSSKVM